ncbi:MAG: CysZ protein [Candidatus Endobugula sp.]|jgi:CysZ protein
MYNAPSKNNIISGLSYLSQGASLLLKPGMKRFVLIPFVANCIVFIILTMSLISHFSILQDWFTSLFPSWSWISYLVTFLTGLFIFFVLLIYGYSFTLLTNIIAAPFYGRLAEKLEASICGESVPEESIINMTLRTLRREMVKLFYFISRGLLLLIGLLLLSFIPLLNLFVPLIALLWGTWVMTLQYIDYPADNHQMPFSRLRERLKQQRLSSIGFGGVIMVASMIPVINIFIMPIAVAGGTLFWINELRQDVIETRVIDNN